METIFKNVFEQLVVLNNFLDKKAFSENDLREEEENYKDFLQTLKELNELLIECKNTPIDDVQAGAENIKRLHLLMDKVSWYIENLHERVTAIFRYYPVPDDL